jgi:hypothetical protein
MHQFFNLWQFDNGQPIRIVGMTMKVLRWITLSLNKLKQFGHKGQTTKMMKWTMKINAKKDGEGNGMND